MNSRARPPAAAPATAGAGGNPPPAALYQQIKDWIIARIRSGEWRPGDRTPSEHELVAQFGVSRMTAHRALRELTDQGLLVRHAGVGTFVAEEKPQSGLMAVASVADEIRARGHEYSCEVVLIAREAASVEVASALELRTGESVFHTICVHHENQVPIEIEDRYVNPRTAPDFFKQDFERVSPSEYLLNHVPLDEVEHVVEAVAATAEHARLLDIRAGQPCLVLTRRTWTGGVPVTLVRCIYPGARYRLGSRFRTDGRPLVS